MGKITRPLLGELIKLSLGVRKRGKAIRHPETGEVDHRRGAEIAGLDEEGFCRLP